MALETRNFPITHKTFTSFDGTEIGYQVVGKGKTPFILCNGLGGRMHAWSPLYNEFGQDFKFITWDYRGLFTSSEPANPKALSIQHHTKDLECLLDQEKIKKTIIGGWSMGVQVCLEYYRDHPEQFRALFLLNGTSGYPFNTALNSSLSKYIIPTVNQLIKKVMPHVQPKLRPVANLVINSRDFIKIVSKLGLIHKNLDSEIFKDIANEMMDTNLATYHDVLDHAAVHDASDVLKTISKPTLIMASTKDLMTPSQNAEAMAESIPDSELFILNNASHYSLLEFPEIINKRLNQFLKEYRLVKNL